MTIDGVFKFGLSSNENEDEGSRIDDYTTRIYGSRSSKRQKCCCRGVSLGKCDFIGAEPSLNTCPGRVSNAGQETEWPAMITNEREEKKSKKRKKE